MSQPETLHTWKITSLADLACAVIEAQEILLGTERIGVPGLLTTYVKRGGPDAWREPCEAPRDPALSLLKNRLTDGSHTYDLVFA